MNNNIQTGKHDPITKDLYWLTGCMKKNAIRDHMRHVYVSDNTMTATDGARMHHIKLNGEGYSDGFYQVAKRTKSDMVLTYSGDKDYSVYPDVTSFVTKPEGTELIAMKHEGSSSKAFANIIRKMETNAIDYNLLNDVLSDGDAWNVTIQTHEHPIFFENGNKVAIVMPIRI